MSEEVKQLWNFLGSQGTCLDGEPHIPISLKDKGWPTEFLLDIANRGDSELRHIAIFVCDRCGCLYAAVPRPT